MFCLDPGNFLGRPIKERGDSKESESNENCSPNYHTATQLVWIRKAREPGDITTAVRHKNSTHGNEPAYKKVMVNDGDNC